MWLVIATCTTIGVICVIRGPQQTCVILTGLSVGQAEAVSLTINALLTLCIEALGYIHGTSLRWALFREENLHFNTNFRLFRSSRTQPRNGCFANTIWVVSLIIAYAASSQLLVEGIIWAKGKPHADYGMFLNGIALLALALGPVGMATISTWAMIRSNSIITWSSNPLNNTLAAIHHGLEPRTGRCMVSVHQASLPPTPLQPLQKQGNAKTANSSILYILLFTWLLPLFGLTAFIVLYVKTKTRFEGTGDTGDTWHFTWSWSYETTADYNPLNYYVVNTPSGGHDPKIPVLIPRRRSPMSCPRSANRLSPHHRTHRQHLPRRNSLALRMPLQARRSSPVQRYLISESKLANYNAIHSKGRITLVTGSDRHDRV